MTHFQHFPSASVADAEGRTIPAALSAHQPQVSLNIVFHAFLYDDFKITIILQY
jgi:hypothetical protein